MEWVIELFEKYLGTQGTVVLCLLCLVGYIAYRVGRKLQKLESLPCDAHRQSIEEHRSDIKQFINDIAEVKSSLNTLLQMQAVRPPKAYTPKRFDRFSGKQSPRKLNENGEALFNDVNGQQFIDNNREFLFKAIDTFSPKTAYDVEVSALSALRMNQNNDIFDGIKNWVYFAPARTILDEDGKAMQVEVDLDDVMFVISLPLRDAYLLEHPDLVPAEELEVAK